MLDIISTIAILAAIGFGAGTLGSMIGVGGGIIIAPALTFMGFPPSHAASTSLFAVTSTSASSSIEYSRQKRIDYRLGIEMAIFAIPGAIIGAFISDYLSSESFKLYFGILLILTGIYLLYRNSILKEKKDTLDRKSDSLNARRLSLYGVTFGAGIVSSVFGVGSGIIFVPVMLLVLGMTMFRAAPTSQLILLITSLAGVITHSLLGHPDYLQALVLAAGAFAGAQVGARLSKTAKEKLLQWLLGFALIGVATKFISDWIVSR